MGSEPAERLGCAAPSRGDSTICIALPPKRVQNAYDFRLLRREPRLHGFCRPSHPTMAALSCVLLADRFIDCVHHHPPSGAWCPDYDFRRDREFGRRCPAGSNLASSNLAVSNLCPESGVWECAGG